MNDLYNTPFETEIRVLLILYAIRPRSISADRIAAYDFIAIYGQDFGITDFNLHGNSLYTFSEFPSKRKLIAQGIKEAALDGMITVKQADSGFHYQINKTGITYIKSLENTYSKQYLDSVKTVHQIYGRKSDMNLMTEINTKAINALRR